MVQTVAQVNSAPQAFFVLFCLVFKLMGPKRSTPVTDKGGENGFNLSGGKLAIGVLCGAW